MMTVANNLQENIAKISQIGLKESLASGFDVKDASLVGEQLWRERRRRREPCFQLQSPPPPQNHCFVSLSRIDSLLQAARNQHFTQQRPPDEPAPLPPPTVVNSSSLSSSSAASAHASISIGGSTYSSNNARERQNSSNLQHRSPLAPPNATHRPRPPPHSTVATASYDDDADLDALIADIDVDKLVQQQQQPSYSNSRSPSNPYTSSSSSRAPASSFSTLSTHATLPAPASSFDVYDDTTTSPYHDSSRSYHQERSSTHRVNDEGSQSRPPTYHQHQQPFSSSSTNSGYAPPPSHLMQASSGACVQCPGHGLPCTILTANTATNQGRQFYKCSLPEDQRCDFFQWADDDSNGGDRHYDSGNPALEDLYKTFQGDVRDVQRENRFKFGHPTFRPGQQEVIEQAMQGRDVFVLMPTGGGKSLCYQLPAWCTPGLAVVVSPLLSLIQDQVQSLLKLGIDCAFLSSAQDYQTEQRDVMQRLHDLPPHGGIKLLYITPEKLNNSQQMKSILRRLYQRNLISRFVIDEAHCLSMFGHSFRSDYLELGLIRREFPQVPIMALTATANAKVVNEAIHLLGMRNSYRYVSSFNRPNLRYKVRKKDGKTIEAIADYIASRPLDSGVIYCLSRRDCETMAEKLEEQVRNKNNCSRVRVSFYHAELDAHERERRHREWSNGVLSVLCATIAFGMGIDKPDVRYVIHYSMPQSITHYYQESGRAGRDGETADCILYYAYKDKKILEHMIVKSSTDPNGDATRRKIDQLYSCVRYCEEDFRCRRTMQLEFFGEAFDRAKCSRTCDNCINDRVAEQRDLTNVTKELLELFAEVSRQKRSGGVTMAQLSDLYRGSKSQSATKFLDTSRLLFYRKGSQYKKPDLDRILHALVFERILEETAELNKGGFTSDYVRLGQQAYAVQNGQRQVLIEFPKTAAAASSSKKQQKEKKTGIEELSVEDATSAKTSNKKELKLKKTTKSKSKNGTSTKTQASFVQTTISIDDSTDESDSDLDLGIGDKVGAHQPPSVLPKDKTQELVAKLKQVMIVMADAERLISGKDIFYWHILPNRKVKELAAHAPTNVEELRAMGIVGENIVKEYGERLVRCVTSFIEQNQLSHCIEQRPSKRPKVDSNAFAKIYDVTGGDNDEFDAGIDFEAIELPDESTSRKTTGAGASTISKAASRKSPYF